MSNNKDKHQKNSSTTFQTEYMIEKIKKIKKKNKNKKKENYKNIEEFTSLNNFTDDKEEKENNEIKNNNENKDNKEKKNIKKKLLESFENVKNVFPINLIHKLFVSSKEGFGMPPSNVPSLCRRSIWSNIQSMEPLLSVKMVNMCL